MNNVPNMDNFHVKIKHINILFQLIKSNNEEEFITYISKLSYDDIDVNMKDENGNYLIFFSIIMNKKKILEKLIEYGSRLDVIDTEGYSILYYPIKFNYFEIINMLLKLDKQIVSISLVNLKDLRGVVPLFYSIKYKNYHALTELLNNGADANYKNSENMNVLHLAVLKKDIHMVKILLKYIKNINTRTLKGSTALHYACNFQQTEIVKILLENGANQNILEIEYDFYPIFYSVVQNNISITKLLITAGTNPNNQDYLGNTIIHYAIMNNHTAILDFIINFYNIKSKGINLYTENINNKSESIGNYIDPNIVNIDGLTIVHLFFYNYKELYFKYIAKILPYSDLNYQDNIGNTVLHIIVENGLWDIYSSFLKHKKLNIYIKNNLSKSVMDLIQLKQRDNVIEVVANSYYNYLKSHENEWEHNWQNLCSKKSNNNDLNKTKNNTDSVESKCDKYIYDSIIKQKISVPVRKNKINIVIENDELVHINTFSGSLLDMICGFKYLIKKYPFAASLFHLNQEYMPELERYSQSMGIQENPHQHIIHFEIRWVYQRIFLPPGFENIIINIINSKKYKYIIIPIGIILSNGSHSNGLFYDIEHRILERFEPHGSNYPSQFNYNPKLLDEILYKKFSYIISNIYKDDMIVKYYEPMNYLPKIGFQTFEVSEININKNIGDPNGFCALWTIWYLDYRLYYNYKLPHYLVKNLIKQIKINNYSFRTIIRNYSKKITDLRDKYLTKIGKNVHDYSNNRLNESDLKKILIEILSDTQ